MSVEELEGAWSVLLTRCAVLSFVRQIPLAVGPVEAMSMVITSPALRENNVLGMYSDGPGIH